MATEPMTNERLAEIRRFGACDDDHDSGVCAECGEYVEWRTEPTAGGLCDPCAQIKAVFVDELLAEVDRLRSELEPEPKIAR